MLIYFSFKKKKVQTILHPVNPFHEPKASALKDHWLWIQETLWDKLYPKNEFDRDVKELEKIFVFFFFWTERT